MPGVTEEEWSAATDIRRSNWIGSPTGLHVERLARSSTSHTAITSHHRDHITNRQNAAAGNSRQRWRIINELLHNKERASSTTTNIDSQSMSNKFLTILLTS